MDSRNKRLAKNTMLLYFRMALSMIVALFTSREVLRVLGFSDYGLYGVIGGIVTMFTFLNGAMNGASSRYISIAIAKNDVKHLNKIFCVLFWSHLGIGVLILLLSETIGLWFLWNKLVIPEGQKVIAFWVYQISVITSILNITVVPYSSMIISHENMKIYAYVSLVEVILRLVIVYLLLVIPGSKLLIWAILGLAIRILVNFFYRIYVRIKYQGAEIRWIWEKSVYKNIFGFVGSDLIGNISVLAQGQGLNILLNLFFGPVVNAARAIAYTVQGVIDQFSNNFLTAVRPQIFKLHGEGKDREMFNLSEKSSCLGFFLLFLIALPIFINIDYILKIWLGKYPDYSVPFLRIIILTSLVQVIKTPRSMIFHALGKLKWPNIIVGSFLLLTFPVSYLFLKLGFSPTSVFWVTFIDMSLSEILSVTILRRYIAFNILNYFKNVHFKCWSIAIISFIIPFGIKILYPEEDFIPVLFNILLCFLTSLIIIFTLGLKLSERKRILETIKTKFTYGKYKIK